VSSSNQPKPPSSVSIHGLDLDDFQRQDHKIVKLKEVLDLQLLYLLLGGPSSGYDLNKRMQKEFGVKVSYGTLYPRLAHYEMVGMLSSSWQRNASDSNRGSSKKKKVYRITELGQARLKQRLAELSKMFNGVQ
jgi:DNA-binding PadR family transcriptional regulator